MKLRIIPWSDHENAATNKALHSSVFHGNETRKYSARERIANR